MVAKRHKITNVPLFKKLWDLIFFLGQQLCEAFLNSGTLIVIALTFVTPFYYGSGTEFNNGSRSGSAKIHNLITVPVPLRQKSMVSAVPFSQHCI
jgi:hypothetical protein